MAFYEDITIDKGSDFSLELLVKNSDGSRKNLTNHTVKAWMKKNFAEADSDAVVFSASIGSPATTGIVNLSLTNAQTDALDYRKKYKYDVELTNTSDSTVTRILEGSATITPSVTN